MAEVDCKTWSMEERKEELIKLVKNFEKEEKYHKSKDFKEAVTRGEFIDTFLRILGWDVGNKQGLSRRKKEVIFEDDVRIGGNIKHPDYALRYNGVTKTFVEAKQPSVDLWNNPQPAIQARTYAYMKKLPIAILTDFEELVIYDTSQKPKSTDKAEIGRIKYLNYKEYVKNFEELFNTISWFAVKEGKFDEYYKTVCEKKGNLSIDEDILQMIEKWRVFLAEDIALHNEEIDEFNLTGFVQKIIDRIIFLRICEDKEIEEYKTLKNISDSKSEIYDKLKVLFEAANKKFNSGLFKTDEYIDKLKVQDKTLCSIIDSLYLPNCLYDFSIISVEILGSIYERFLGKIIHFTRKTKNGHSVEIVEKPEVQKAGGVYYTPSYIVQYIVERTIGKKIDGKTPEQVAKMHFVDPACGSGSFLVGAYQYLLDWHLDFYLGENLTPVLSENEQKKRISDFIKAGNIYIDAETEEPKLTLEEKKRILLNNIYGVDIDMQAVEVTKLSLFLKMLEDEGRSLSNNGEQNLFRTSDLDSTILPNLTDNIKCGNSLIGKDYYDNKMSLFFDTNEYRKINHFDWIKKFKVVFDNGGFDCVIGNPPYVSVELMKEDEKEYYKAHYEGFIKRCDLFGVFLNKALKDLVNKNGFVSFIIPSVVHTNLSYQKIRDLLLNNHWLQEVCYTGGKVFDGVTVDTTILICKKSMQKEITLKNAIDFEKPSVRIVDADYFTEEKNIISIGNDEGNSIFEKLFAKGLKPISEDYIIYQGIVTGNNPVFIFESEKEADEKGIEKELLHPLCHGRDIGRYETRNLDRRIMYVDNFTKIKKYPNSEKWLTEFKSDLKKRREVVKGTIQWCSLQWPREKSELDVKEKILIQNTRNESLPVRICATLDNTGVYGSQGINFVIPKCEGSNLLFLLAILNSSLINYLFATKFLNLAIKAEYVKQVKLPAASLEQQKQLAFFAEQMLIKKRELNAAKSEYDVLRLNDIINDLDSTINAEVYKLYGLTEKEIAIIEGK